MMIAPGPYPGPDDAPLDFDRVPILVRRSIDAEPDDDHRAWLDALLAAGARIHLDLFDERGFARLALGEPTDAKVIHIVGALHWTSLSPDTDLDDIECFIPE